jgi:hypothetical protein
MKANTSEPEYQNQKDERTNKAENDYSSKSLNSGEAGLKLLCPKCGSKEFTHFVPFNPALFEYDICSKCNYKFNNIMSQGRNAEKADEKKLVKKIVSTSSEKKFNEDLLKQKDIQTSPQSETMPSSPTNKTLPKEKQPEDFIFEPINDAEENLSEDFKKNTLNCINLSPKEIVTSEKNMLFSRSESGNLIEIEKSIAELKQQIAFKDQEIDMLRKVLIKLRPLIGLLEDLDEKLGEFYEAEKKVAINQKVDPLTAFQNSMEQSDSRG